MGQSHSGDPDGGDQRDQGIVKLRCYRPFRR